MLILTPTYTYLVVQFRNAIETKLASNKGTQTSITNVNEILTLTKTGCVTLRPQFSKSSNLASAYSAKLLVFWKGE